MKVKMIARRTRTSGAAYAPTKPGRARTKYVTTPARQYDPKNEKRAFPTSLIRNEANTDTRKIPTKNAASPS